MRRFAFAILLISSPTLAQDRALDSNALRECSPIGQSAKGELIYGMDCKALKPENISTEYKPDMPRTDMKDTVIPKSGKTQTPETTPTTGANR